MFIREDEVILVVKVEIVLLVVIVVVIVEIVGKLSMWVCWCSKKLVIGGKNVVRWVIWICGIEEKGRDDGEVFWIEYEIYKSI